MRRWMMAGVAALALAQAAAAATTVKVPAGDKVATFAGGCFWCMQQPFDRTPGVVSTVVGYTGGRTPNPSYEEVSSGQTGHAEAVDVVYDPRKVSYEKLLEVFWVNVDPTTKEQQFCDAGTQYTSAIFFHDDEQRRAAEASRAQVERTKTFKAPIVTRIEMAGPFYPAEDYHQDYYLKNPVRYQLYRKGCGRDARLHQLWGDKASH